MSETEDPIEMIRRSGADPQVLGRIWEHYRDRLRRVVRLRLDDTLNASSNPYRARVRLEYRWATEGLRWVSSLFTDDEVFY